MLFPVAGAKGLWLELAIVADHTMLKFHGRERVKHYILAIMNIVSKRDTERHLRYIYLYAINYKCRFVIQTICVIIL